MHIIKNSSRTVLLVDDCPFTRRAILSAIETAMPECKVVCAPSLMSAQAAGAEFQVDLFIVDAVLPDGSGIDFLADMLMVHDQASAILLADGAVPTTIKHSGWFQQVHILRKAINRAQLLRLMGEVLGAPRATSSVRNLRHKPLWSARLEEISPEEIIHRKLDLSATSILEFVGHGEAGVVYFLNGRITFAEVGNHIGDEALRKIMTWRRGYVFELPAEDDQDSQRSSTTKMPKAEPAHEIDRTTELNNVANVVADDADELDGAGLRASSDY